MTPADDHAPLSRRRRQRRQRRRTGLRLGLALACLPTLAIAGVAAFAGAYVKGVADTAPALVELPARAVGANTVVYAADGSRLGYIRSDLLRAPVSGERIPDVVREATVAVEDRRFYRHDGVDFTGVLRAGWANAQFHEVRQGASTLTMQLARNAYISDERTLGRKIAEAKLALELEQRHSKAWVLEQYLNRVPYGTVGGQEVLGVQAASRVYFSKPAARLRLHEAALLAGLPQAPSQYYPFDSRKPARARRNEVLDAMVRAGYINAEQAQQAKQRSLGVRHNRYFQRRREAYVFDYVREELVRRYGENAVRMGGMRVYTTIEPKLQRAARASIRAELDRPEDPAAAVVSVDPSNGRIRAMASSGDYARSEFNLAAQGRRQPGSTFKTMALMAFLERRADPRATTYISRPLDIPSTPWGPIHVKTYDGSYRGATNVWDATLRSDNAVYTQLTLDVGPDAVKRAARRMGVTSPLDANPSLGLGGLRYGVSPLEMASAYGTLAAGGRRIAPTALRKVVFSDGSTDRAFNGARTRAFAADEARTATDILQENLTRGTGTGAAIRCPAAGKTGTTDSHKDAWFAGYTPRLSTAVWVGYPDAGRAMTDVHGITVSGGTFPASIWRRFMEQAVARCRPFTGNPMTAFKPFTGAYATGGYVAPTQPAYPAVP